MVAPTPDRNDDWNERPSLPSGQPRGRKTSARSASHPGDQFALPTESPHDEPETLLSPPRVTPRAVAACVTLGGCLLGVMALAGGLWLLTVLLLLSLVIAHVAGNSLGTRLRDRASQHLDYERRFGFAMVRPAKTIRELIVPQPLSQHASLSRIAPIVTASGALFGGVLGGMGSAYLYPEAGAAAVALGVVSAAVLGGFAGFALASFISVARSAWEAALCDPKVQRLKKNPPRSLRSPF